LPVVVRFERAPASHFPPQQLNIPSGDHQQPTNQPPNFNITMV